MTENWYARMFEHNNWANQKIIEACSELSDDQLDADPQSATEGSIRSTLLHLVNAQEGYHRILTMSLDERVKHPYAAFEALQETAQSSGEGLLALARGKASFFSNTQLETRDEHFVEPWVVMVQVINHATEHREQIKSMLTALGITPPDIDGWDYGFEAKALVPKNP